MPDRFFGLLHHHLLDRLSYAHHIYARGQRLNVVAGWEGEPLHHRTAYTIYIYRCGRGKREAQRAVGGVDA